jgi:hypothetical protein
LPHVVLQELSQSAAEQAESQVVWQELVQAASWQAEEHARAHVVEQLKHRALLAASSST